MPLLQRGFQQKGDKKGAPRPFKIKKGHCGSYGLVASNYLRSTQGRVSVVHVASRQLVQVTAAPSSWSVANLGGH